MDTRGADSATLQKEMVDRAMAGLNTCLPGIIISFDSATQTAVVQPAIKMKLFVTETESFLDMSQILNVPIIFPFASTAGFALTLPIQAGDPCLLVFSQRCIDNWHQLGGLQPPENGVGCRHHDLTDAFAILGPSPIPNVLGNWAADGISIRNRANTIKATVKDDQVEIVAGTATLTISDDGKVTVIAPDSVSITSPLTTITGDLLVTGYIQDAVRKMSGDRTIYNTHTHSDPQGGATGVPNQQE